MIVRFQLVSLLAFFVISCSPKNIKGLSSGTSQNSKQTIAQNRVAWETKLALAPLTQIQSVAAHGMSMQVSTSAAAMTTSCGQKINPKRTNDAQAQVSQSFDLNWNCRNTGGGSINHTGSDHYQITQNKVTAVANGSHSLSVGSKSDQLFSMNHQIYINQVIASSAAPHQTSHVYEVTGEGTSGSEATKTNSQFYWGWNLKGQMEYNPQNGQTHWLQVSITSSHQIGASGSTLVLNSSNLKLNDSCMRPQGNASMTQSAGFSSGVNSDVTLGSANITVKNGNMTAPWESCRAEDLPFEQQFLSSAMNLRAAATH